MTSRAVGYIRVSTEDQAREGKTSPADQEKAIRKLADELGAELVQIFRDEGVSGTTSDRPGFNALVAYVEGNKRADSYVLCLNDSRFGRFSVDEAGYWRHRFQQAGYVVRFAEGGHADDPTVEAVLRSVHAGGAQQYSVNLSKNVKRGKRGAAEQGLCIGRSPYGYLRRIEGNGRVLPRGEHKPPSTAVRYWPEEGREQENVVRLFTLYAQGRHSLHDLAREMQIRDPSLKWSHNRVRDIIRSPVYIGTYVACDGAVVLVGNHPPLVDRNVWQRCQARLLLNQQQRRGVKTDYPLSGLLTCKACGSNIVGVGGAPGWRQYGCSLYRKGDGRCTQGTSIVRHILEPLVFDAIAEVVSSPETNHIIESEFDRLMDSESTLLEAGLEQFSRRREKLEKQRDNLVRAIANGLTPAEAQATLQPIREELDGVESEIHRLRFAQRRPAVLTTERQELLAAAKDFRATLETLAPVHQRELLRPWLESGVVSAEPREVALCIRRVPEGVTMVGKLGPRSCSRPEMGRAR